MCLIHRFDRKGIIYMDVEEVLKKSEINLQGLKTTALHHQFEYVLLFYLLNHSEMPSRYVRYFTSLQKVEQSVLISYIACKYVVHINNMDELIPFHPHQREKILQKIHRHPENQWSKMLVHKAQYIIDTIKEKVKPTDATITFSGVDGAGKSTILQLVKEQLEYKYHKRVKVLRHRPGILPILSSMKYGKSQAEKKASSSLPRKGTNSSFFSSMGRFLYYYMDYLIGQVYVFFRYQINGNVILYDRYYFDFIIDPRRSNISLKPSFLRLGYSFVVKPEVNFFLYAPAQEILSRKQELSEEDIRTMTSDYQKLFKDLSGKYKEQAYLSINNTNLNTTIESVMKQIIPRL